MASAGRLMERQSCCSDFRSSVPQRTVAAHDALSAEVRLYDRLFTEAQPDTAERDFKACLNSDSKKVVQGWLEPSLAGASADDKFQFGRHGYVADAWTTRRASRCSTASPR